MRRTSDPLADPESAIRRVYSYVAYIVGDGPEAEDITSATLERALRYRQSYDERKGTPIAWLIGIARGRIADLPRRATVPLDDEPVEAPELADEVLAAVDRIAVRAAVATLDVRERELVALRYGADLTARQIGELLGMRTNAVEVALHRLHARLRLRLAREFVS